jgi:hypothetical protein
VRRELAFALVALAACQRNENKSAAGVDCARVAETLATFEMGSAAKPDARPAVVAKHRAACESTNTTSDEARCLFDAKDTWAARACLPRMFGSPAATGGAAGCAVVVSRMRDAVLAEAGSSGSATMAAVDQLLPVIQQSCEQDAWPAAVLDCIGRSRAGDLNAFQTCANQLPQEQQQKLAQRLTAQQQAQQQPPTPTPPK